jgi:hypothetical protein
LLTPFFAAAQTDTLKKETHEKAHWYDKMAIRGYMQVRYNRLLETNPKLRNEQGDKSIGDNNGFFIRRARIIFFGQIHERVYFYIQPDFGNAINSTTLNVGQMRDAYVDVGFDKKNEFRIRIGLSKIPYGFENMQSSQNRIPLDRSDGINSAAPNERDMGAFFYWAPDKIRKRFAMLVSDGLKGSGDYGVFGFGICNGQGLNKPELNNGLHMVGHITYPFLVGKKQIIEPYIQAYTGDYVLPADQLSKGVKVNFDRTYLDRRAGAGFTYYPQPLGIQAEYNIGKGPQFNTVTDSIESRNLQGGYAMINYNLKIKKQQFFPFVRAHFYNGGKKFELDARSYNVKEYEAGVEWQPMRNFEFTVMYTISERRYEDFANQNNLQKGSLLRLQAQLNF